MGMDSQSREGVVINRRAFLKRTGLTGWTLAGMSAAGAVDGALAKRVLGRTGAEVTVLGLGTAPIGEGPPDLQEGIRIFGEVLDQGVNYVDTARIYGNAEECLGHLVPSRRDDLFLVSKVSTDAADKAEASLSESLRLLKTDYLDVCHIHSVGGKDIDRVLANEGVLEYLLKQKEAGKIRFIGISGHNRPANFVRLLETDQIDVVMCVLNYADRNIYDFEHQVIPVAKKHNAGIVAMKVYVGIKGGFPNHKKAYVGCATPPERLPHALAYALDLDGVSTAVVGPYTQVEAMQNIALARAYTPLGTEEYHALLEYGRQMAPELGPRYGAVA